MKKGEKEMSKKAIKERITLNSFAGGAKLAFLEGADRTCEERHEKVELQRLAA